VSPRRIPGPVLALTPGDLRDETAADFRRHALDAVEAGLDSILVREPEMSDRATLELARALRELLGAKGWLGIHDRVHLATAAGADGVHLGFRSLAIHATRAIVADDVAIGYSAHAHDEPAAWSGADYLVFGPVYATPSKHGILEPVGIAGLLAAVRATSIPIWALGGIDAARVPAVQQSGCRGIAARGALLGAHDARAAWLEFAPSAR